MIVLLFSETTHWFHNVPKLQKVPSLQKDFAQAQGEVRPPGTQVELALDDERLGDRKPVRQIDSGNRTLLLAKEKLLLAKENRRRRAIQGPVKNPPVKNPKSLPIMAGST
jgi:hypothetical protein